MTKTERLKEVMRLSLGQDITDLRDITIRDGAESLGFGIVMLLIGVLHLMLSAWQFLVGVLIVGYDLVSKGLARVMQKTA